MKIENALLLSERLRTELAPACERIEIAGGIRRGKPDVHDIELVAIPKTIRVSDLFGSVVSYDSELDAFDFSRMGQIVKGGSRYKQITLPEGINLDLFIVKEPAQFGVIYTIRTGPADFSHWIVTPRRKGGALPSHLRVADGAVWDSNILMPTPEEEDFFRILELDWLSPDHRKPRWHYSDQTQPIL